jgi:hypothetical protein
VLLRWQLASKPEVLPPYDDALLSRELALFDQWYVKVHRRLELSAELGQLRTRCLSLGALAGDLLLRSGLRRQRGNERHHERGEGEETTGRSEGQATVQRRGSQRVRGGSAQSCAADAPQVSGR